MGDTATAAGEASSQGRAMAETMGRTLATVERLAAQLQQAGEGTARLTADAERIGTVLDVINGAAEQTNLLALNAAIEAARAGRTA